MAKRTNSLGRGKPLVRRGHRSTLWDAFSAKVAEEERNADGLIQCAGCKQFFPRPDLHHKLGKNSYPELYFVRSNLTWLCRGPGSNECHAKAHSVSDRRPDVQQGQQPAASDDRGQDSFHKARQGASLRRSSAVAIEKTAGVSQTVFSSRRRGDDYILPKPPARFRPQPDLGHHAKGGSLRKRPAGGRNAPLADAG